jgi:hypothetical protein
MNAWLEETTADREVTEDNPEKVETNPEMIQSKVEHREVPMEEATVISFGTLKKRHKVWSCRVTRRAKGTDQRRVWILEEVGCCLQEGVPSCSSGTVQGKCIQKNSDLKKLVIQEQIVCHWNEDDPQYRSCTTQGTWASETRKR